MDFNGYKPLVSVIVPIFNVEQYLEKCLKSILSQTYQNLEIILVNDGSTDGSLRICRSYKDQDSRVIIVDQKNTGLSGARNSGLRICKGEYVSFIDSDDYIDSTMIETLLNLVLETKADFAICDFIKTSKRLEKETGFNQTFVIDGFEAAKRLRLQNGIYYSVPWNKLYSRKMLSDSYFPVGKLHEDEYVIGKLLTESKRIACTTQQLYFYNDLRPGSIMNLSSAKGEIDVIEALTRRCLLFSEVGWDPLVNNELEYLITKIEQTDIGRLKIDPIHLELFTEMINQILKIKGLSKVKRFRIRILLINPTLETKIFKFYRRLKLYLGG